MSPSTEGPSGAGAVDGVVHRRGRLPFTETVDRLREAVGAAGATLFAVVDHSGDARRAGLELRDTNLLIFGNPRGGTPAMAAAPLAALDLPLKILVWVDDEGAVWMSHLTPDWLADRHGLAATLVAAFAAPDALTARLAAD